MQLSISYRPGVYDKTTVDRLPGLHELNTLITRD